MLDRSAYGLTGEGSVWHHEWNQHAREGGTLVDVRSLRALGAVTGGALLLWGLRHRSGIAMALAALGAGLALAPLTVRHGRHPSRPH